ncbi:MAG: hypothetical protein V1787_02535 [Candidatus Micrarchaeota archaeon]
MREEDAEFILDDKGFHKLRSVLWYDRGLRDFVMVYLTTERGFPEEIARFDCSHGFAHRDLPYLPAGDKRRKAVLAGATRKEQYCRAMLDIHGNWMRYHEEWTRWRK